MANDPVENAVKTYEDAVKQRDDLVRRVKEMEADMRAIARMPGFATDEQRARLEAILPKPRTRKAKTNDQES